MKSVKLTLLFWAMVHIATAQIAFEKELSGDAKLVEISEGINKLISIDSDEAKIEIYNLDYTLWKTINIPEITDFEIDGISFISQGLFNKDEKTEYFCEYYRSSPYLMVKRVYEEDGGIIFADTNVTVDIINTEGNTFKLRTKNWDDPIVSKFHSLPGIYAPQMNSASNQSLSLNNDTLLISDGNYVYLGNYNQKVSISNDTVYLSNGGFGIMPDNKQTLSLNNDTLSISDGNKVYLGSYLQEISISNDSILLSNGGALLIPSNNQSLIFNNDSLSILGGNSIYLGTYMQQLSISNDTIYLSNGGSIFIGEANNISSIENIDIDNVFGLGKVYPNPSSKYLNVNYVLPRDENSGIIAIYDNNGVQVLNADINKHSNSIQFEISHLKSGAYNVILKTENGYTTYKKAIVIK